MIASLMQLAASPGARPTAPPRRTVRVLHVLPALIGGGMERAAIRLIRGSGNDPAVSHGLCILREAETDLIAQCRPPARIWVLGGGSEPSSRLSCWWRLRQVIRQYRPDIVHARSTGVWPDAALATRGLKNVKLLLSFHGRTQLSRPSLKRRLLNRWAASRADTVLTVSRESADYLCREWGVPRDKLTVIHNGVNTQSFRPATGPAEIEGLRHRLGVDSGGPLAVCVANFMPIKALDVLLRAWRLVIAEQPAAKLLLAGDGPLRDQLQSLSGQLGCDKNVLFAGAGKNVAELLRAADLFVLPSRYEACSNAILEAMASGLPVVACDAGGNAELVATGRTGWLVQPESPEALAAAILNGLRDQKIMRQAGQAARARVLAAHNESDWLTACTDLYATLADVPATEAELCAV